MLLSSVVFALAIASIAWAEYLPFSEKYYDDLYEGEDITPSLGELDTAIFTYYGTNYSIRVLSVYSDAANVRVKNKALDINLGETHEFELDDDGENDFNVTLVSVSSSMATLKLALKKLPEEEPPVENVTNTTNSTAANSTNTTNSSSTSSNSNSNSNSNSSTSSQTTSTSTSNTKNTNTQSSKSSTATGDVVYNVNIDITIPPGSGVGVLVILAIVLGGLFVYKRVKGKYRAEEAIAASAKKQHAIRKAEPRQPVDVKKSVKRFVRKTGRSFTVGRKRFAEIIAGDSFVRKPKT